MNVQQGRPVSDLVAAKKRKEQRRYADMVLDTFDRLQHQESRGREETRAKVERKAREAL